MTSNIPRSQAMNAGFQLLYGRRADNRSMLVRFYAGQAALNAAIDLHREFPLSALRMSHPDLHGGAKRFHSQFVAWTRDLKHLGHKWVRDGRRVLCARCHYEIRKWACAKGDARRTSCASVLAIWCSALARVICVYFST